jgi:GTP cyclohydrolase IA
VAANDRVGAASTNHLQPFSQVKERDHMHREHDDHTCDSHDHPPAAVTRKRPFDSLAFEKAVRDLLEASGIEIDDAHTGRTAQRVRELWQKRLLDGYDTDPADALGAGFEDRREDMVVIRSIAVHGVCPHHLLPFRGVAHVAYLPGGRLHGFGRIARMIDAISHRFTYQEWITHEIATALVTHGNARGAACVIEAEQLCLLMGENRRGDERVVTQCYAGEFDRNTQARNEFLRAIHR